MKSSSLERVALAIYGVQSDERRALSAQKALSALPGVRRVYVSAETEMAFIEYEPAAITRSALCAALQQVGLQAGELDVLSVGSGPGVSTPGTKQANAPADLKRSAPAILADPLPARKILLTAPASTSEAKSSISREETPKHGYSPIGVVERVGMMRHLPWGLTGRISIPFTAGAVAIAAVVVLLVWVLGLGQATPAGAVTVEAGSRGFSPMAVVIPAGQPATLLVLNSDVSPAGTRGATHQFAISELGINVQLQPGQSTLVKLPALQPGTYHYVCSVCCGGSRDPNMQGALIIR